MKSFRWSLCIQMITLFHATAYRPLDGYGNNLQNPEWGASNTPYARLLPAVYEDGIGEPTGSFRRSPREISNLLNSEFSVITTRKLSDWHTTWGHLIAIDIVGSAKNLSEPWPIQVPECDLWMDPDCEGNKTMHFQRTNHINSNPREQINTVTSFIDMSVLYGSTNETVNTIRTFIGGHVTTDWTKFPSPVPYVNPQIISLVYLLAMEHNRIADSLSEQNQLLSDEILFQEARRWLIAFQQKITTREYLASLLGKPLGPYIGYNEIENPTVTNELGHAILRYGHSEMSRIVARVDETFNEIPEGHMLLRDCWGRTRGDLCFRDVGFEPIYRGLCLYAQQEVDTLVIEDLRNYLFSDSKVGSGTDLLAIDVQRGRDHGLPDYNSFRTALNLSTHDSFASITTDTDHRQLLQDVYGDINDIDLLIGALSEDNVLGSNLGVTMWTSIYDYFHKVRDGDRFWYENSQFSEGELSTIYGTTLRAIIQRNTNIQSLPTNVFFLRERQLNAPGIDALFTDDGSYPNMLDLSTTYRLSWLIENDEIQFKLQALATGWVGIGFDPLPNTMKGADIYLCRILGGVVEVIDSYALDVGVPTPDIQIGGSNDVIWSRGNERSGITTIEFRRKFDTGDPFDKVIIEDTMKVIFAFQPTTKDFVYHGPTRSASARINFRQTVLEPVLTDYPNELRIALIALAVLGMFGVIVISVAIIKLKKLFIYYTLSFCLLTCLGGFLGYIYIILLAIPIDSVSCIAQLWTIGFAFIIAYGCLFVKTWRLWRVHEHLKSGDRSFTLTDKDLLKYIGGLLLLEAVYLIFWTALAMPRVEAQVDPLDTNTKKLVCVIDSQLVVGIWIALKALLLFFGVYMAFQVRNVPDIFNESKVIGISIYTVALVSVIAITLGVVIADFSTAVIVIKGLAVWLVITPTLIILYIPKIFSQPKGDDAIEFTVKSLSSDHAT